MASGFLNPSVNNNGASFGLFVALLSGGDLIPMPIVTSLNERTDNILRIFPNPASHKVQISFEAKLHQRLQAEVYMVAGSLVKSQLIEKGKGGVVNSTPGVPGLKDDVYRLTLRTGVSGTRKLYITP